jgi:hypothetical protein
MLVHLERCDEEYGRRVAEGLGRPVGAGAGAGAGVAG